MRSSQALHPARSMKAAIAGLGLALAALPALADVGLTRLTAGDLPVTLVYPTEARASLLVQGPFEMNVALDAAPS